MFPELPWEVHPDLLEDRLIAIACVLVMARNNAVLYQNEEIGDDNWILGCRGFQFCRHEVLKLARSGGADWLEIVDESKHLIFKIGAVPVRFYRGLGDEPNPRTLRQTHPELEQLSLIFPEHDLRQDLVYRFAIETDFDGTVVEVKFVGLLGERALLSWTVPLERMSALVVPIGEPAPGVDLPAPHVSIPGKEDETKTA